MLRRWEAGAFAIFAKAWGELQGIFQQYAKAGAAGSGSAQSAMTMQKTELTNLALDCEICNAQFTDAMLGTIYERADQVDDTLYRDETTGVQKGAAAKGGDKGLEIHEFCECLCMIALARANPKYGTVGNTKTADADSVLVAPMPGCLDTLMKRVLKNAKTDVLGKVSQPSPHHRPVATWHGRLTSPPPLATRGFPSSHTPLPHLHPPPLPLAHTPQVLKRVMKEPEIRAVFNHNEKPLKKAFEARSNAQFAGTKGPTMTLENLIGAMNERKVAKDVVIDPVPAISGTYCPDVHSNLSQLDIRSAFVTAQGSGSGGGSNNASAGVVIDYQVRDLPGSPLPDLPFHYISLAFPFHHLR
mgnify:CR=1 FL=1